MEWGVITSGSPHYRLLCAASRPGAVEDTNIETVEVTTFGADLDSPILSAELF